MNGDLDILNLLKLKNTNSYGYVKRKLDKTGKLTCYGLNYEGQTTVPAQ